MEGFTMKRKMAWLLVLCMLISIFSIITPYGNIETKAEETVESTFVHPGLLHTQESIDAVKQNIADGVEPTSTAYGWLLSDGYSNPGWNGRPLEHVLRGGAGDNRAQLYGDIERAYHTALLWKLGAGDQYGDSAVRVLNGWSHTMKSLSGNADRFLAAGIYGYQLANVAELVRDHEDFDKEAMDELLLNVFYPMNKDFLVRHNNASISNYWANWDLCNIASMLAIGIFCDREDIYNEALNYYKNGEGMGALFNTMPYVYEAGTYGEELAQWQEAGRDQGHATLGVGLCGAINEMAWSQGDDLYGMSDNRFLKAAEYVVRYNNLASENCDNVPFSDYTRFNSANHKYETGYGVSGAGRPSARPVYTAIYNHYVNRMGLEAPELEAFLYPEDGNTVIEGGQRNGDEPGWQSLMFHNISTTAEGEDAEAVNGPLEDGIYRFTNHKSRKSLVDKDGALQCAAKGSMEEEWWNVKNTGDGEYVISNAKTGRVIQINATEYTSKSAAYITGTTFVLGETATGEMNQRLAILKKSNDYVYRIANAISSHVMELANANTADDATICQWRYEGGAHQEWFAEKKEEKGVIAYFNFDDEAEGLEGAGAVAEAENGTLTFVKDEERGKVLSLSDSIWLNVTKEDGTSLLSGNEELTFSYYTKAGRTDTNWAFYAAPDTATQTYNKEQYIGGMEKAGKVSAERYARATNGRETAAGGDTVSGWNHIVIVYTAESIKLYINGTLASEAQNAYSLADVLGTESILQIGKANWTDAGEYYEGYMDDFTVYNYALDDASIQAMEEHQLVTEFTFDDEMDGFTTKTAKAVNAGTIVLSEDAKSGKALSLDGMGSNYLSVEDFFGNSLLNGWEEVTISYWSKVDNAVNNWMFYLAPDDEIQILNAENYIGAAENNGYLNVERYKNTLSRVASLSEPVAKGEWKQVTTAIGKDFTRIYINGEKAAELKSHHSLTDILGENSVFYIGKANWGKNSEFSNTLIDNVRIYNFALNDAQAAKDYAGCPAAVSMAGDSSEDAADKAAAQNVIDLIHAIGTVEYTEACLQKISNAQTAYDNLTETQKNWVSNMYALKNAWKQYKELAPIEPKHLATFTFDDENNGFVSGNAKAESVHTVKLSDNAVSGKALRLDGNESQNYLRLLDAEGNSLLKDCKEVTVSYWSKIYGNSANWGFYAAANDETVINGREKYLGIYDLGTSVSLNRYYNAGTRPADPYSAAEICEWRYITAVYGEKSTSLYINGKKVDEVASEDKISTILGEDGVAYLGKANWGNGEYYNGLLDEVSIYNYALSQEEISTLYAQYTAPKYPKEKKLLAQFTFDDEENGFGSADAVAKASGTNVLSEDAVFGKSLSLDGTGSNYLSVTDKDGNALLNACEELTVSYWTKVDNTDTNWAFYASKNADTQEFLQECYLAAADKGTSLEAVRWKNAGIRTENPLVTVTQDKWRYVTVVYNKMSTAVYVNGTLKKEMTGSVALPDIVGEDGVFYLGKANWGSGEYFNGLLDEVSIYNYALSAEEITALYKENTPADDRENTCLAQFTFDDEETGFSSTNAMAKASGTNVLSEDAVSGKALNLDGTGANYLKVTDKDGNPLLTDCKELTVSYWRKVDNTDTNWVFFAAADDNAQNYLHEQYIGLVDSGTKTEAQRWMNTGVRAATVSTAAAQNAWEYVTYVFGEDTTKIYVNGKYSTGNDSSYALENILGESSVLYLGKANWGSGEYFNGLLDEVSIFNYALQEDEVLALYENYENPLQNGKRIAGFTFDDKVKGFAGEGAKAENMGSAELSEDAVSGQSLYLDGTGANYLEVTDTEGNALLTGSSELTISYWSKVENTNANWAYFVAPDAKEQIGGYETYFGLLDKGTTVTAERYNNTGVRPASVQADVSENAWKHITVVYHADKTQIYVNGEWKAETGSSYALADIAGENGIFYVGKANWGTGEYYQGYLDEVSIYDYALDAKDVSILYQAPEAVNKAVEMIKAIGTVENTKESKDRIDAAREAYDALFKLQKEMFDTEVYALLTNAEETYQKLVENSGQTGGGSEDDTKPGEGSGSEDNTKPGEGNGSEDDIKPGEGSGSEDNTKPGEGSGSEDNTKPGEGSGSEDDTKPGEGSEDSTKPEEGGSGETTTTPEGSQGGETTTTPEGSQGGETTTTPEGSQGGEATTTPEGSQSTENTSSEKETAQAGTISVEESQQKITTANTDNGDVAGSTFAAFKLKAKEGNKSIKLSWSKISGADGYILYGAPCGKKMKVVKELSASKKSYTVKKLAKGKYYKYMVVAYKNIYGEKRTIETSVTVHIATKGGKYGNPSAITYAKKKISLKKGKTFTLKPKLKYKKKVKTHIAKFRYESSNPAIATVSKKGKIKGIRKGNCEIYMYTQSGLYKKVKVKVK